jgi:enamine deaminase RidA (YjgF/YER057c/UK114 family)
MRFQTWFILAASAFAPLSYAKPVRIPASGGDVIVPTDNDVRAYESLDYAAMRQAGDFLYVSGVVVRRRPEEGRDVEAFKAQVRRAFQRLDASLKAAGVSFADMAMVNTFHVWNSPDFAGGKDEHFDAFLAVRRESMRPPHAAWTAVGTTELLGAGGTVEIQFIGHNSQRKEGRR